MTDRQIDWRAFLGKLIYCHGCGRFGMPRKTGLPTGWRTLYQPHPEGPPGLNVCSEACAEDVRKAMAEGPVVNPLRVAKDVIMDSEMRQVMFDEAVQFAIDSGRMDDLFLEALRAENGESEDP